MELLANSNNSFTSTFDNTTSIFNLTTTIIPSTTTYVFVIPSGVLARLWQWLFNLLSYSIGLILCISLFYVCYHKIKESYVILILNQLIVGIIINLLQLVEYIVVDVIITSSIFILKLYRGHSTDFDMWFIEQILISGPLAVYYIQLMTTVLLCINRCVTMYTRNGAERFMTKKLNIVYSTMCYAFCLPVK
jgi:hypothetical protein